MQIEHEKFLKLLQIVGRTVAGDDRIPVYKNICFNNDNITSYDGISGTACKFRTGLRACINAEHFLSTIGSLPGDFELTQDDASGVVFIRYGASEIEIPSTSPAGFPDFIPKTYTEVLGEGSLLGEALQVLLKLTAESKTPQFAGIGIHGQYAYATDGSRATRFHLIGNSPNLYSIPLRAASKIAQLGTPLRVVGNKHCLVAMYSTHLFVTQLNSVNVPVTAIDRQFTDESVAWSATLPKELATTLKRCRLYANEKSSGTRIRSMSNHIVVESQAVGKGKITERIDHPLNHDFDVYVNPSQILDVLTLTDKVNLHNIVNGDARFMRFDGPRFSHLACLMARAS